jgi:group I intron endonuclease
VYLHENRVNGKKYIGITCQRPERRWNNGNGYAKNRHFSTAIQKYGWHSFRHEILYTDLSQTEAERIEIELIEFYQTRDPYKGYNLTAGGDGVRGLVHTPETRARMSKAHTGVIRSAEYRANLSRALTGLKKTPEHCAKISEAKKGVNLGAKSPFARSVRCVETGVIYPTLAEAARANGLQHSKISLCCQGKRHTTGGYHWEYYNDTPILDT